MFEVEYVTIRDTDDVDIGTEIKLTGEIRRGLGSGDEQKLKSIKEEIENHIKKDVVAINLLGLSRWDSLGIFSILDSVVKTINPVLIKKGKTPISIIGRKKSDVFVATRDKYPDSGGNGLPWFTSLDEFIKEVESK